MKSVTSTSCIEYLKAIFAVHGIAERLYTDNAKYRREREVGSRNVIIIVFNGNME